ncbi:cold-inducible RNA-binding protein isoform X7 [Tiliqua scincoides]|uniref:cold-inducible RNA-binding protein isoform X7 n=1 Tax=Tiliqua scincoides TaxID=71010 RepID=UPI0034623897
MASLLMAVRLELIKLASHQRTDPVDTEGAQLEAEAFSVEAEAEVGVSPGVQVETEAMVAVDLNPEVEGTVVPEITIAAGVKAAMATGLQEGPTETAMTVMVEEKAVEQKNCLNLRPNWTVNCNQFCKES